MNPTLKIWGFRAETATGQENPNGSSDLNYKWFVLYYIRPSAYFGAMRSAPSMRIVSPLM